MNGRTAHTDIDRLSAEEKVEAGVSAGTVLICRAGIDIGSTTVKLVILDQDGELLFGDDRRHHARTRDTLAELLRLARSRFGDPQAGRAGKRQHAKSLYADNPSSGGGQDDCPRPVSCQQH